MFRISFLHSEVMCVLASEFKRCFEKWGYQGKILLKSTAFPDELLQFSRKSLDRHFKLIFLARIEKTKGIYEAIDCAEILSKRYPDKVELIVAGSGGEENNARKYVESKQISNVIFAGYVQGKEKYQLLADADCYLFPTVFGEGMPCSVLEAMGAGLPVITTHAGGIPDFFENEKMGFLLEPVTAENCAEKVSILIENEDKRKAIGDYNRQYAGNHFSASHIAAGILQDLEDLYEFGKRSPEQNSRS